MITIYDLYEELNVKQKAAPLYQDQTFFKIECRCEFEPFGRATEDWDIVWVLTLPLYPWMWKNTDNLWVLGKTGRAMFFEADTLEKVIAKAIYFIREYREQLNGLQQKISSAS